MVAWVLSVQLPVSRSPCTGNDTVRTDDLPTNFQAEMRGSAQNIMAMSAGGASTPNSSNNAFVAAGVLLCHPEKPTPAQCDGEYGIL